MLRRVNAGLYEEDDGANVQLAVKATNNGGVEAAQFDYDSAVLDQDVVDGSPGCRFTVKSGTRQFRSLVVFSPTASASARYDLFQVNPAGTLTPVGKNVTNTGGTPLIGFGIAGVAVAEVVEIARARRRARKRVRPKPRQRMRTRRKAATPSRKKKASTQRAKAKSGARKTKRARPRRSKASTRRAKRTVRKSAKKR
jgi:hypothetical protein